MAHGIALLLASLCWGVIGYGVLSYLQWRVVKEDPGVLPS